MSTKDLRSKRLTNIVGGQVVRRGERIALCEECFHPVAYVVGRISVGGYMRAAWWHVAAGYGKLKRRLSKTTNVLQKKQIRPETWRFEKEGGSNSKVMFGKAPKA